ncbi:hypothetical protein HDU92_004044 [Lobulomyces angularis]|nr:hypothetical protein HDU92_004044 [Lobulomyces angularis]
MRQNLLVLFSFFFSLSYSHKFLEVQNVLDDNSPNCVKTKNIILSNKDLEAGFNSTDLFFSTLSNVCDNLEIVTKLSFEVSTNCNQVETTENFQSSNIFKLWGNSNAATVACSRYLDQSCLSYIIQLSRAQIAQPSKLKKDDFCNSCLTDMFKSLNNNYNLLPQVYYSVVENREILFNGFKNHCSIENSASPITDVSVISVDNSTVKTSSGVRRFSLWWG